MKAAETDATKRALATFGNPFGLALYDKDKLQVTRSRRRSRQACLRQGVPNHPASSRDSEAAVVLPVCDVPRPPTLNPLSRAAI
jgi:hypothetical protein